MLVVEILKSIPYLLIGGWIGYLLFCVRKLQYQYVDILQMLIKDAQREQELLQMLHMLANKVMAQQI